MPVRALLLVLVTSGTLVLAPQRAAAQAPEPGSWLLSPMLGLALDADADPSLTLGAAVTYPVTASIAAEAELAHVFDMAPGDADVDSSLTTIHVSALYFFNTLDLMSPYVAGGIGIGHFSHDVRLPPASIDSTEVGFNLGAGLIRQLNERLWARGDFRYLKHIDDVPSVWRFAGAIVLRLGP
jgi:opacity protein-like surface antigen